MKNLKIFGACLLAGLFVTTLPSFAKEGGGEAKSGEFADISMEDLETAIQAGEVTVIDVNGTKRYKKGHIPGALDFAGAEDLAKQLPEDKEALIVAYCGGPKCRAYQRGAQAAKELGYLNVKHLSAGISGWKKAGKELAQAE